jgi:hypothetical protein
MHRRGFIEARAKRLGDFPASSAFPLRRPGVARRSQSRLQMCWLNKDALQHTRPKIPRRSVYVHIHRSARSAAPPLRQLRRSTTSANSATPPTPPPPPTPPLRHLRRSTTSATMCRSAHLCRSATLPTPPIPDPQLRSQLPGPRFPNAPAHLPLPSLLRAAPFPLFPLDSRLLRAASTPRLPLLRAVHFSLTSRRPRGSGPYGSPTRLSQSPNCHTRRRVLGIGGE